MSTAISILGSTGSIGCQTLDVVRRNPERFTVKALAANTNVELVANQVLEFQPEVVAVGSKHAAQELQRILGRKIGCEVLCENEGMESVATFRDTKIVIAAIVGVACLGPVLAALTAGKHVALANKESLVAGGSLVKQAMLDGAVRVLPIDSEHSSIYQCMLCRAPGEVMRRIILTASGGPFLRTDIGELASVTPQAAIKHPRWEMGAKISVDSATMMNKGLEVIEASWLFDLPGEKIDVLIHPESVVHGIVEFEDGVQIAALSHADMRAPISFALSQLAGDKSPAPRDLANGVTGLNLETIGSLSFESVDRERFPALDLAYEALRAGGSWPIVLNAANEVCVAKFIGQEIGYLEIVDNVKATLDAHSGEAVVSVTDVMRIDAWARSYALNLITQSSGMVRLGNA